MKNIIYVMCMLLLPNFVYAVEIKKQTQTEYATCYRTFDANLYDCKPFTCSYPDLADARAWKAHAIIGEVNKKCYVVYYSYIDSEIISDPDHCFYTKEERVLLGDYYRSLFKASTAVKVADLKEKIARLSYVDCKKKEKLDNKNGAAK